MPLQVIFDMLVYVHLVWNLVFSICDDYSINQVIVLCAIFSSMYSIYEIQKETYSKPSKQ